MNHLPSFLRQPAGPVLALWMALAMPAGAQSQWVAFNDHYRGPNTAPNVSSWNVFTNLAGAPGISGPLTNVATGVQLPVTLTVTSVVSGIIGGTAAAGPNTGTPASLAFTNYIDFGIATVNNAIQLGGGSRVAHIFSGCDPSRRYSWRGTAARANNYQNRWTLVEVNAASSTPAHATAVADTYFTTNTIGAPATLTDAQVVCNFGENRAAGMLAGWDNIEPNPDGTITIFSSTWRSTMPGTNKSDGTYGYAIAADRLEEFQIGPAFAPTNQNVNLPADANVPGCSTLILASFFQGSPAPTYLWYKDGAPMDTVANPSAATPALSLNNIQSAAAGKYQVRVSNALGSAVSREATVTVTLQPPHLVSVVAQSSNASSFLFTFDVPVAATAFDYFVVQFVSRNGLAPDLGLSAFDASQVSPTAVVVTSQNPRQPGVNYLAKINSDDNGVTDVCAGLKLAPTNMNVFTEIALADYENAADLWSYEQSGADRGTAWREQGYDDSAWPTGPAPFGLEPTAASILVGPIRTPWTLGATKLTYYLRKSANVPAPPSQIVSLTLIQQVDDGSLTYINGIEVDRFGFAAGVTVTNTSLSTQAAAEPVPLRTTSIGVTNVIEGTNVIAVEVHQTSTTSTDVLYGSKLIAICSTISPGVTLTQSGSTATISWPEYGVNGQLQTSSDLITWTTDGRTPSHAGNTYSLTYTVPAGAGHLYIRLRP